MLFRLLIYLIAGILIYRIVRRWFGPRPDVRQRMANRSSEALDDVMVQDPYCGVYFPRREGIALKHNGQELLFCSKKCQEQYLARSQDQR